MTKDQVINSLLIELKRVIYEALNNSNENEITEQLRNKIFNVINNCLTNNMGLLEYENFCKYLIRKGLLLVINSQDNIVYVNFYDGLLFYKIDEIINNYYNEKIEVK